jgi:hypothetical protein
VQFADWQIVYVWAFDRAVPSLTGDQRGHSKSGFDQSFLFTLSATLFAVLFTASFASPSVC